MFILIPVEFEWQKKKFFFHIFVRPVELRPQHSPLSLFFPSVSFFLQHCVVRNKWEVIFKASLLLPHFFSGIQSHADVKHLGYCFTFSLRNLFQNFSFWVPFCKVIFSSQSMSNRLAFFDKLLLSADNKDDYFRMLHLIALFSLRQTTPPLFRKPTLHCENCDGYHVGECQLPSRCTVCNLHHRSRHCPLQHGYRKEIATERSLWKTEVMADDDSLSVESGYSDCTSTTYSTSDSATSTSMESDSSCTSRASSTN